MTRKKFIICISILILILSFAAFFIYRIINNKPTTTCKVPKIKNPKASSKTTSSPSEASSTPKETVKNTVGNTSGNLMNGGLATEQGNWVYYSFGGIYKVMPDMETGLQKICDDNGYCLNVVGEWLYYIEKSTNKLYKIKTNGKDKTVVINDPCSYFVVKDNYIYYWAGYVGNTYTYGLYKIKVDGGFATYLRDIYSFNKPFTFDDNYMYSVSRDPVSRNGVERLTRTDFDGKNTLQLTTTNATNPIASDGWIYHLDNAPDYYVSQMDDNYQCNLWRVNNTGSTKEKLCSSCFWFNIKGDYIYYMDFSGKLYKMKRDGSQKTEFKLTIKLPIYNPSDHHILLTQDYILIFYDGHSCFYKIKYDGSVQKFVN